MPTGNLALSRALGDFEFKRNSSLPPEEQIVTADPDIIVHQQTPEDEFVVIACDGAHRGSSSSNLLADLLRSPSGIWDVLSNQQVVDWIRRAIAERKSLQDIAEQMLDRCLAPDSDWGGVGCDNMTIMIIGLLGGRTKEEWYDTIAKRVERGEGYPTPSVQQDPFSTGPRAAAALPPGGQIKADGLPPNLVAALKATGLLKEESTELASAGGEGEDSEDVEMAHPGTDTPEQIQDAAPKPTL